MEETKTRYTYLTIDDQDNEIIDIKLRKDDKDNTWVLLGIEEKYLTITVSRTNGTMFQQKILK